MVYSDRGKEGPKRSLEGIGNMLYAVIMAGGAGTRFWPESRGGSPKQLLPLAGERTMIQSTVDRLQGLIPPERIYVITNRKLVSAIRDQLPELSPDSILGEPCKRDTAPCVGLAAELVCHRDAAGSMVVLPSDHVITPAETFRASLAHAASLVEAQPDRFVTFGIPPTYPAESFGYIERGEPIDGAPGAYRVVRFREKPNKQTATEYLQTKRFYWNAGIFVRRAAAIRDALRQYEPEMADRLKQIGESIGTTRFAATLEQQFEAIRGKSVDYAIMEHYPNVAVLEASFAWDDLGSWQSIARLRGADSEGNTILGKHIGVNTQGTIVKTDDRHLVVTLGLRDCLIVRTPDATLVANKHDEESIRKVVEILQAKGWAEYL